MSTITNIDLYMQELENSKQDLKSAIIAKGVTPTGGLSSYAEAVLSIPASSEMTSLSETITENGEYNFNPIDDGVEGYSMVDITVDIPIPTYTSEEKSVTITQNGTQSITPSSGYDGLSKVDVTVNVASTSGKPQIPNGFRFTGGDIAQVDFSQYDWSMVYDTSQFFAECSHSTGDWSNFEENFNGRVVSGDYMFAYMDSITSVPSMDTSKVVDMSYMFYNCENLETVPNMDLSSVFGSNLTSDSLECGSMFFGCTNLKTVGKLTTPNTRVFSYMFNGCKNLTYIPDIDFDNAVRMVRMFRNCPIVGDYIIDARNCVLLYDVFSFSAESKYKGDLNLSLKVCNGPNSPLYSRISSSQPKYVQMYGAFNNNANLKSLELEGYIGGSLSECFRKCSNLESLSFNCDFSKVTNVNYLFQDCNKLESIPDMNLSSVTTFMGSNANSAWLLGCTKLKSIGVIDCDSCTQAAHLVPSSTVLTDLGGFRNFGKASTMSGADGNYFLYQTPNLTYESLMNVINMLYDRATNGLSTVTIKLHTNHMALLSEEDIAIATNKGWILTA